MNLPSDAFGLRESSSSSSTASLVRTIGDETSSTSIFAQSTDDWRNPLLGGASRVGCEILPPKSRRSSCSSTPVSSSPSSASLSSSSSSRLSSETEVECRLGACHPAGSRCFSAENNNNPSIHCGPLSVKQPQQQQQKMSMSGDDDDNVAWCRQVAQQDVEKDGSLQMDYMPQQLKHSMLHQEQFQKHSMLQQEQFQKHSMLQQEQSISDDLDASFSSLDPSSLQLQKNLQFRFLHPDDIDELKGLCTDCFPVEYPEEWYQEITKDDGRFFSLASTLGGKIVGFIVAEIKTRVRCNKEDQDILSPSYPLSTPIAYILSLGVLCPFRCQGVGSLLLDNLLSHLTSKDHHTCKAVFLHVLCTNQRAIRFYERRHFTKHSFLPLYYSIQGKLKDGYSYVLYLNGGHPPWSLRSSIAALASFNPCKMSSRLFLRFNQLVWCFIAAVFVSIKKTTAAAATSSSTSTASNNSFNQGYHKS